MDNRALAVVFGHPQSEEDLFFSLALTGVSLGSCH